MTCMVVMVLASVYMVVHVKNTETASGVGNILSEKCKIFNVHFHKKNHIATRVRVLRFWGYVYTYDHPLISNRYQRRIQTFSKGGPDIFQL